MRMLTGLVVLGLAAVVIVSVLVAVVTEPPTATDRPTMDARPAGTR